MEDLQQWITTLIANKEQSDVELHVEVVQERHTFVIPAHTIVLRHVSRVFDTMLEPGKFKESTTGVVQIKVYGTKADAVSFIKYLYTKKLQTMDTDTYSALMQTADFYEMTSLLKTCEKRIRAGLTPFSVCVMYSALHNICTEGFRDFCNAMMLKFAFLIFGEKLHITLSEDAMVFLLSSEKLNVLDEEQVLRATWDWGHSKCILENVVDTKEPKDMVTKLLPLIKWSDIFNLDGSSPWSDLHTYYEKLFKTSGLTTERKVENSISLSSYANFLNIVEHVERTNCTPCDQSSSKIHTLITFTSDHTVLLTGIEIHVGISPDFLAERPFTIYVNTSQIPNISYKNTLLQKIFSHPVTYHCIFTLDFWKPVVLKTNKNHSIKLEITDYDFKLQKLDLNSSALEPGILGSDDEVSFSAVGQITAIQKLFYFLQS